MTTYNGEKYLNEQLQSILIQLEKNDEIIVCDDGSTDATLNILEDYRTKDSRLKIYKNKNKGVILNFEDAISKCNNDIIFLCDQDDIWLDNKVKLVKSELTSKNKTLVLHNGLDIYENGSENTILIKNMKHGVIRNIIRSNYWGCCMAFKKELVPHIIPFPKNVVAHDQWIGIIGEKRKESFFLDENLIFHRRHNNNVTRKLPYIDRIKFRFKHFLSLIEYSKKK